MYKTAIVVLSMAMLVTHCQSMSAEEFERANGATCGLSNVETFDIISDTKGNEFPWTVELFYTVNDNASHTIFKCEGSLISRNLIITNARCLGPTGIALMKEDIAFVRLGRSNRNSPTFTDIPVEKTFTVDPGRTDGVQRNDIGLVKLQRNVEFSDAIKPLCLPLSAALRSKTQFSEEMFTSGYGSTPRGLSMIKRKGKAFAIDLPTCRNKYGGALARGYVNDDYICAGGEYPNDTCIGYNGTPLMLMDNSTSHWTLFGVASFGAPGCTQTGHPSLYTAVLPHLDWILDNAGA